MLTRPNLYRQAHPPQVMVELEKGELQTGPQQIMGVIWFFCRFKCKPLTSRYLDLFMYNLGYPFYLKDPQK